VKVLATAAIGGWYEARRQAPVSDRECTDRVERLESRLMFQESALEELTRTVLAQQQQLREQGETIQRLETELRALVDAGPSGPPAEEPPPPHY
jgi:uncharacterized coiled-coil protein SlyX